jgi:hypothetical protein
MAEIHLGETLGEPAMKNQSILFSSWNETESYMISYNWICNSVSKFGFSIKLLYVCACVYMY